MSYTLKCFIVHLFRLSVEEKGKKVFFENFKSNNFNSLSVLKGAL